MWAETSGACCAVVTHGKVTVQLGLAFLSSGRAGMGSWSVGSVRGSHAPHVKTLSQSALTCIDEILSKSFHSTCQSRARTCYVSSNIVVWRDELDLPQCVEENNTMVKSCRTISSLSISLPTRTHNGVRRGVRAIEVTITRKAESVYGFEIVKTLYWLGEIRYSNRTRPVIVYLSHFRGYNLVTCRS